MLYNLKSRRGHRRRRGGAMVETCRSRNHLLAALPKEEFDLLRPFLSTLEMVQESVLVAAGDLLTHVYFPHSGVISLVVSLTDGQMVEVAMIGRDSLFGGSVDCVRRVKRALSFGIYWSGMNRRCSRKLSKPPRAMRRIQSKCVWRAPYCECTISRRSALYL